MANKIITANTTTVNNISSLADKPSQGSSPLTSAQVKALFDKTGSDLKTWINGTLNEEITKNSIPFAVGTVSLYGTSVSATIAGITSYTNGMGVAIEINDFMQRLGDPPLYLDINSIGEAGIYYFNRATGEFGEVSIVSRISENTILTLRYSTALNCWIVQ